jgi:hypothetical protein
MAALSRASDGGGGAMVGGDRGIFEVVGVRLCFLRSPVVTSQEIALNCDVLQEIALNCDMLHATCDMSHAT